MAAELITPLDEATGMPLPILPQGFKHGIDVNWHHAWHAESAPELQSLGGKALRHSRVQLVHATYHNQGDRTKGKLTYHDFYIGPPLPDDETEQFNLCVISAAGYVPKTAIDLHTGGEPRVVRMSDEQMDRLRKPAKPRRVSKADYARIGRRAAENYQLLDKPQLSEAAYVAKSRAAYVESQKRQATFGLDIIQYRYQPMRDFFRAMILKQDLTHVRGHEAKIEEFLQTPDPERKLRLGRWLLAQAVDMSTDTVRQPYHELRAAGLLHPKMPVNPNALVTFKLGDRAQRSQLVRDHEKQLRLSLGVAA